MLRPRLTAVPEIRDDDLPESLYHYTDVGGLHGILKSKKLYATHVAYLNDSQETLYGMQVGIDQLKELGRETPQELIDACGQDDLLRFLVQVLDKVSLAGLALEFQKEASRTPSPRSVCNVPVNEARSTQPVAWVWQGWRIRHSFRPAGVVQFGQTKERRVHKSS